MPCSAVQHRAARALLPYRLHQYRAPSHSTAPASTKFVSLRRRTPRQRLGSALVLFASVYHAHARAAEWRLDHVRFGARGSHRRVFARRVRSQGHNDSTGGFIVTRDVEMAEQIRRTRSIYGGTLRSLTAPTTGGSGCRPPAACSASSLRPNCSCNHASTHAVKLLTRAAPRLSACDRRGSRSGPSALSVCDGHLTRRTGAGHPRGAHSLPMVLVLRTANTGGGCHSAHSIASSSCAASPHFRRACACTLKMRSPSRSSSRHTPPLQPSTTQVGISYTRLVPTHPPTMLPSPRWS